jgi:SAM-dependent MidA family methyltransferase
MTSGEDLHESAHAAAVLTHLRAQIAAAGGWIAFDAYMQQALYAPGLGYYSAGAHKLGRGGDFTTAPEISPLFGRCLAQHCAEVLTKLGGGNILEIGAGSGRMAFDVLQALTQLQSLPERYNILEVSADLRARQQRLLVELPPAIAARVHWLDAAPRERWRGALLTNEVLDALPVQRVVRHEGQWCALGVGLDAAGNLQWVPRASDSALRVALATLPLPNDPPEGYASEHCPLLAPWLQEVTSAMTQGVALFIDYGLPRAEYYSAARERGTLRCHYRQQAHDNPFAHPGLEDITAWVDFTAVAEAGEAAKFEVLGYATQAAVLLGLGIEAQVAAAQSDVERLRSAAEAKQLLLPTQMGESFKVIALGRDYDAPLAAFRVQDLRERL